MALAAVLLGMELALGIEGVECTIANSSGPGLKAGATAAPLPVCNPGGGRVPYRLGVESS
jgi:hypothetical protein